jgi:hypothetical protein
MVLSSLAATITIPSLETMGLGSPTMDYASVYVSHLSVDTPYRCSATAKDLRAVPSSIYSYYIISDSDKH